MATIRRNGLSLDLATGELRHAQGSVRLSPTETRLLARLMAAPGVVTVTELVEAVYGDRADGGPEDAKATIAVFEWHLCRKIAGFRADVAIPRRGARELTHPLRDSACQTPHIDRRRARVYTKLRENDVAAEDSRCFRMFLPLPRLPALYEFRGCGEDCPNGSAARPMTHALHQSLVKRSKCQSPLVASQYLRKRLPV